MGIFKSNFQSQKGQALLIVVLVMVVALTVTLSLVSRSVVDLKTSTDQADSQRAIAAAEAGAEQAIKANTNIPNVPIGNGSTNNLDNTAYKATITQVAGSAPFLVNGGNLINKDEGAYIWLSTPTYNSSNSFSDPWSGKVTINWGEDNSIACNNAALEITVLSGTKLVPVLTRYAFDPCSDRVTNAVSGNHFTLVSASAKTTVGTKSFYYQTIISITNGFLVNVNPIYHSAYIGVKGSVALPVQGSIITSSGSSRGSSSVIRKITVFQGYPQQPAELFPYSILSP